MVADWRAEEKDRDLWPVQYPVDGPPRGGSGRFRTRMPPRWAGSDKQDTANVRRRLLWLLLAIDVGMILAAACMLPLVFLNLSVRQEGIVGAILSGMGEWLGISSQAACLVVALPIPILVMTMSANLWLYRWLRRRSAS